MRLPIPPPANPPTLSPSANSPRSPVLGAPMSRRRGEGGVQEVGDGNVSVAQIQHAQSCVPQKTHQHPPVVAATTTTTTTSVDTRNVASFAGAVFSASSSSSSSSSSSAPALAVMTIPPRGKFAMIKLVHNKERVSIVITAGSMPFSWLTHKSVP